MNEAIIAAIGAARTRLNASIVAHRALAWTAPSAAAAGILLAIARAAGLKAPAFALLACLVAVGAALGAARAWKSRVDMAGAARWLDERLGGGESLTASLVCLGRGSTGRFDAEIVREAEALAPRAEALRASPRPLAKKAAIAAAGCALGAYLVFLAAPLGGGAWDSRARSAGSEGVPDSLTKAAAGRGGEQAASAFASSLFPDDKRLATLAERALLEGRLGDLRDMLKAADLDYGSRIARSLSEAEKKKLTRERERIQQASNALAMGAASGGQSSEGEGRQGQGRAGSGSEGARDSGPGSSAPYADGEGGSRQGSAGGNSAPLGGRASVPPGAGSGGGGNAPSGDGIAGTGEGGQGGSAPGTGAGSAGDRGTIQAAPGNKKAVLETTKDASFFELLLPGQDSSAPISRLVPNSARAAESAMAREPLPLEYRDFVRSYFMALSQGQKP